MAFTRTGSRIDVNIANGATTSQAIDIRQISLMSIITPGTLTSTSMSFTVCDTASGTFVAPSDSVGVAVPAITIAVNKSYDLPTALASALYLKIVLGSAEGGARVLTLCAKG